MLKYRGTYRVMYEMDKSEKPCEFTLIPCRIRKDASICRHNDDTLNAYIPSIKTVNRLLRDYPDIFKPYQIGDSEGTLLFAELDMIKAAAILKPRVLGKNLNPKPKKQRHISEAERKILSDRMKKLNHNRFTGENTRKTG